MLDFDFFALKLPNGRTAQQQLEYEGRRFKQILDRKLQEAYNSYSPFIYGRTYGLASSVGAPEVEVGAGAIIVRVDSTGSEYHAQEWANGQVNTMLMLDEGYASSPGSWWGAEVDNLGHRTGLHFLDEAIAEFNAGCYFDVNVVKMPLGR